MLRRRRHLWYFAVLALLIHLVLIVSITVEKLQKPPEPPLSGKFVKRRPLRQRILQRSVSQPRPVRALRRSVVAPQAFARTVVPQAAALSSPHLLTSPLLKPSRVWRPALPGRGMPSRGRLRSAPVSVGVQAMNHLNLGLELLDVKALDTGQYRGLVVQDGQDQRQLKGFVRFAAVGIRSALREAAERDPEDRVTGADQGWVTLVDWRHSADVRALDGLAAALKEQTQLQAQVDEDAYLDEPGWMDNPFILLTSAREFIPSADEVHNLGAYLTSGGFAYVEVVGYNGSTQARYGEVKDLLSLRDLLVRALADQGFREGRDWSFAPLPMSHPLFHCYYDFESLPGSYWSICQMFTANAMGNYGATDDLTFYRDSELSYLEGVHLNGRLVAIYSQQNYRDFWSRRIEQSLTTSHPIFREAFSQWLGNHFSSEPGLRLGINIIVFALTQEGSLARRYVNTR